jgi:putative oxidoreductase
MTLQPGLDWTLAASSRYAVPLARALFAAIFLAAPINHFAPQTVAYAAQQGLPIAQFLVPASGVLAALGGLSVALGYRARLGALTLALFLIPVTLMMHAFWKFEDSMMIAMQQGMFMKNLALLGGALLLVHFGAGPFSLDARRLITRTQPAQSLPKLQPREALRRKAS